MISFVFARSLLMCTGFLELWQAGLLSSCSAPASHCGGFSYGEAQALGAQVSIVAACRLSGRGAQA